MKEFLFEAELWLPRPRAEVFAFFADAHNLETITPPWLKFEVLTPRPVAMQPGTLIDYRIRIHGVPVRWRTEITVWQPPTSLRTSSCAALTNYGITRTPLRSGTAARFAPTGCAIIRAAAP